MKKLLLAMVIAIVTATAVSAQEKGKDKMTVSSVQTDKGNGYGGNPDIRCGITFNIWLAGVTNSLTPAGMTIRMMPGWCCAGHPPRTPTSVMHP